MLRKLTGGYGLSMRAADASLTRVAVTLTLALIAVLLTGRRADAQGAAEMLPQPISTGELVRYMQQLDLSDQQQLAVTAMHDEYKRSYRSLYENEIEDFLDEMRGFGGFSIPERQQLQDLARGVRTMEGRIRSLDSQLFDRMQTLLTDDQLAQMPRIRLARNRATYNQQQMLQMWTMGSPIVDVSATIIDLKLPPSDVAVIDSLLARYESNLTSKLARLHDSATSLWLDMYDAIEAAGFNLDELREMGDMEDQDPEQMQKMMEAMQQIFMDLTAKGREEVDSIRTLNRETVRSFNGLLSDEAFRRVRNAYYGKAYPRVSMMTQNMPVGTAVLDDLANITADQKQSAADAIRGALDEMDRLIERAITETDAFRSSFNFMDFDQEKFNAYNELMNDLQQQATDVSTKLRNQLNEILSSEQLAQYNSRMAELAGLDRQAGAAVAPQAEPAEQAGGDPAPDSEYAYVTYSPDMFLPPSINRRDLTAYYNVLAATDDQRAIIRELHKSYAEKMKTIEQDHVQKVVDAQSKIWRWGSGAEDEDAEPDLRGAEERINTVFERRIAARKAIEAADNVFLDDVALVLTDDAQLQRLERIRQMRARQRYNTQAMTTLGYRWGNESQEHTIDIVATLANQNALDRDWDALEPILTEYDTMALPVLRDAYEQALNFERQQQLWTIRWQEIQQEEGSAAASSRLMTEYQDTIGAAQKRLGEAQERVASLNAQTIQRALQVMTHSDTVTIRQHYNRTAFPGIYVDEHAVQGHLDRALALESLTPDQRGTLIDLQAEHTPTYEDLCQQMLTLTRNMPSTNFGENEDWRAYQEYQDEKQRIRFERRELNSRTLLRLRQTLTDEQIEALGGLPDVAEKADDDPVYW